MPAKGDTEAMSVCSVLARRCGGILGVALVIAVGTTGCYAQAGVRWLGPLAMTVREGDLWFHWCGTPQPSQDDLMISGRTGDGEFNVFHGEGAFALERGDEFSPTSPPGLVVPNEPPLTFPIDDSRTSLFIGIEDENGGERTFRFVKSDGLASLAEGELWLSPFSETPTTEPCTEIDEHKDDW